VSYNVPTARPPLSPIGAGRGPVATLYSPEEDLLASLNSHADRNPLFAACFGREESEVSPSPASFEAASLTTGVRLRSP
jgi:hypothetical protein